MKKFYFYVFATLMFSYCGFSQELLTAAASTFTSPLTGWTPSGIGSGSGFDIDTRTADGSMSYRVVSNGTFGAQIQGGFIPSTSLEAGTYRISFYVKRGGSLAARAQVQLFQAGGSLVTDPTVYQTTGTGWELVTRDFTLTKANASFRIANNSNVANDLNRSLLIDDVSIRRVTTESPYSYNFSPNNMGWFGINVTSTVAGGVLNLPTTNAFPRLKQYDNYVNATLYKYVRFEIRNNSANNLIQISYNSGPFGANTFVTRAIVPSTTEFNVYEFNIPNANWTGNIEDFNFIIRNGTVAVPGNAVTGSVDFRNISFSQNATSSAWTGGISTVWTTAANWDNGVPGATTNVTIRTGTFQPVIASNVAINSLTIATGATLNVASGNLTVAGAIANSGTMNLANNANLIQGGTTNTNTGNISVNRNNSTLLRLDYTLWSSPVTNAAFYLKTFSPATLDSRFYSFNATYNVGGVNGAYSAIASPSATNFAAGRGYLIRMPDNADAVNPTVFSGVFMGVPNNGVISVPLTDGAASGLRYNLVGNPYPSPIMMSTFIADNTLNIEPTLYFWRKTNGVGSAYCTWNGGVFVTNGNAQSVDPLGVIQTGQGFFVEARSGATSLNFNNLQRLANNTGQFFKTKQVAATSRIWLNATNTAGYFTQMAVAYTTEATQGLDRFDGKYFNDSPVALTSNINDGEYTIQGRPAFDPSDVVSLNFKTDLAGDYTIAIDHSDGVFATGQDIYLVDSKTGTETDLKLDSYTFTAKAGLDNARFSLKYQKTLKVDAPAFNENNVRVYKNNGALYVNSGKLAINSVQIYDIQGRLISERKNVKSSTVTFDNLKANNQVLLVKIEGEDNSVVTKKVVN